MIRHILRYMLGLSIVLMHLVHSSDSGSFGIKLFDRLDAIIYDAKLRLTMPGGVDDRVVILDIDEKSLAEQGRWPWSRDRLALMLDKLFDEHKVSVVAFDVVFAEPDDSSGINVFDELSAGRLRGDKKFLGVYKEMRPQLDYDSRFAAAMEGRNVILGYSFSRSQERGFSSGAMPEPVLPAGAFSGRQVRVPGWQTHTGNLDVLQAKAAGAGHFNPMVDFDGISRRIPLLAEYSGAYFEPLSLAVVRALYGFPAIKPGYADAADPASGLEWIEFVGLRNLRIPVDENAAALIPYRGPQGSFPYISITDVLNDRVPPGMLRNRVAIVGTTAPGLKDLRATPVGEVYPGVESHANLIVGMLDGAVKAKPAYLIGADFMQVLLVGLLMVFTLPLLTPSKATLLTLLTAMAVLYLNFQLWIGSGLVLPLANVTVMMLVLYGINMSWGYFLESRSKAQMTGLFGQYVPPELVDEMAKDPGSYSMAGRRAELTVLFSDVRDFTSISEKLQPDDLANLMNEYLGAMTDLIRKQRGTLDKYIGDAIMAFWGAPVDDEQHAVHSVHTALTMQAKLLEVNENLQRRGWPELRVGVGINSGPMTVGDMGTQVRRAYTVMGDAVNLASRLEGMTKEYGVGIVIGETTAELLQGSIVLRELDRVRVKGKAEASSIHEPICIMSEATPQLLSRVERWGQVLEAYRAQQWDSVEKMLSELRQEEDHPLYALYARRCAHYRENPPGPDWDGVTTFRTK